MSAASLTRRGTVKTSITGTRMVEVVSGDEPANDELAPAIWPMPAGDPIRTFRQIEDEANAAARAIVRGVTPQRLQQFEDARERPTHRCLLCGTEYFAPGVCDHCDPDVELMPIQRGPLSDAQLVQGDLENHHLKVSGELERRRDHSALQLQADMPKWGL